MGEQDMQQNIPMARATEVGQTETIFRASPPPQSLWGKVKTGARVAVNLFCLSPMILAMLARVFVLRRKEVEAIRRTARKWPVPVLDLAVNRDPALRQRALELPVARTYPLMWQKMEGYCGDATVQNVLASAGICQLSPQERKHHTLHGMIPEVNRRISDAQLADKMGSEGGGALPTLPFEHDSEVPRYANTWLHNKEWSFDPTAGARIKSWTLKVLSASEGYQAFLKSVKRANDPGVRIFANYLRSPLLGLENKLSLLQLLGGHFSPIIGYIPPEDLVTSLPVVEEGKGKESGSLDGSVLPSNKSGGGGLESTSGKRNRKSKLGEFDESKGNGGCEGETEGGDKWSKRGGEESKESRDGHVVLMDLNAKYGLMLVPAQQMFDVVNTMDFVAGTMRGLVVLDMVRE